MEKGSAPPFEPEQMQQAMPTDAPPSYEQSQNAIGVAPYPGAAAPYPPTGAPYPPIGAPYPPTAAAGGVYPPLPAKENAGIVPPPAQTVVTQIIHVQAPKFGYKAVNMTCPFCNQNITTQTSSEPSVMAWAIAAALCVVQLYCCVCIPCCIDSLQATTHKCPACKKVVGKYSGNGQ